MSKCNARIVTFLIWKMIWKSLVISNCLTTLQCGFLFIVYKKYKKRFAAQTDKDLCVRKSIN